MRNMAYFEKSSIVNNIFIRKRYPPFRSVGWLSIPIFWYTAKKSRGRILCQGLYCTVVTYGSCSLVSVHVKASQGGNILHALLLRREFSKLLNVGLTVSIATRKFYYSLAGSQALLRTSP